MHEIKDTQRATVRIGYDGRVHKRYRGPLAHRRYENEVRVLRYLEGKGCDFVPQILEEHPEELYLVTTNCGKMVERVSEEKSKMLFDKLEALGVRHEDAFTRNMTYDPHRGQFCIIDFEFSVITETGEGLTLAEAEEYRRSKQSQL